MAGVIPFASGVRILSSQVTPSIRIAADYPSTVPTVTPLPSVAMPTMNVLSRISAPTSVLSDSVALAAVTISNTGLHNVPRK